MVRVVPDAFGCIVRKCHDACPGQIPGVGSDLECGRPTKLDEFQRFGNAVDFVKQVEFGLRGRRRTEFRKNSIGPGH